MSQHGKDSILFPLILHICSIILSFYFFIFQQH